MHKRYPHQIKTGQTFRYCGDWWTARQSPGGALSPKPVHITATRQRDGYQETLVLSADQKLQISD